jgi:hypothetical protein
VILDGATECVEFSVKRLSLATCGLEGAIVLSPESDVPVERPLRVCGACAGLVLTGEGLGVYLGAFGLLPERLEQALDLLPFSKAEQLGLVEIRRAERSPNLALALHQRAQCERDDAKEVPRGTALHQHGP